MTRPFRFGVTMMTPSAGDEWRKKCRRAEELGYDVILVADHLGMPAPFPALVAAAEATERPRVGTFVLNAGFWNPVLLAREVATADALTGGRLELGLGTGYVKSEFDAAGLPWPTAGARLSHLARTIEELDRLLASTEHRPEPRQRPRPPLLVGGNGDRVLKVIAEHADIAAFTGTRTVPGDPDGKLAVLTAEAVDERVAAYQRFAAGRSAPAELNLLIQVVEETRDRRATLRPSLGRVPHLTEDEALEVPILLLGTVRQMADQLRAQRERYGFSYIAVLEQSLEAFGPVIEELRGE
ncbi:TIGR03621 family F420-dependent LLM class oxidoreductase [Streptomyces spectabilis]|uniref:Putative F420-dependent oxidoreductase n=1 Tax=Streptomyces spectabilis TaxID=68270 RepID=A0A5P2X5M0_STRST|nr:TIGR03621 family F420-dependent LLM class oxidoreductase [Streptomyces spectabilis]MBB5101734.1 putative F420-dependent oxidoreductase [Streptomyces spectabilis]MCI3900914.1 TIGR03621 family F420-dependent LLM class oxidoreductase [Streptomyces spectabilis]QEV58425.1 TIGR03621 family F420-dependent LLM class oxidoreductase [Streptomyces spectabilis]GGV49862.1 LLM class F420-dependent oxidoreductase [Streptomyces spectabilis]